MARERIAVYSVEQLEAWPKPLASSLKDSFRARYESGCAGLMAALSGEMGLTSAARMNGLCRKRLKSMIERAPRFAPDGQPYGFRVCVPWGAYHRTSSADTLSTMPTQGGPHAMTAMLAAQPKIAGWVDAYSQPLPRGKPPKSFVRLHSKILTELRRLDLGNCYPLNQPDQGRRALLRFLRQRRIDTAPFGDLDEGKEAPTVLSDLFRGRPFSRAEFDAHRIDIEAVVGVAMPNGGVAKRPITTMWLLCEIETESRAIVSWTLRIGLSYNNLDSSACVAKSLQPWTRRTLTIPGLEYAPGACGMPGDLGARRALTIAMDNAKAHHSADFEQGFCRAHGGILVFGFAHEPRSRPIIEQFFSRLEMGVLREVPGGFEPAKRLGDNKIRISNFAPEDFPIQMHLFEELLDVIVANYNATPHPAIGNLSPLQFLQMQSPRAWDFTSPDGEKDAIDMGSVLVPLVVKGNRKYGIMPHVNYMYVRYRCPELDANWELIGKTVYARINRHDLRTFVLYRSVTTPIGVVRAAKPWDRTRHDQTTRALIMQWCKQPGGLSIVGADCAVSAYIEHLRKLASYTSQAVDQLARMQQQHPNFQAPAPKPQLDTPLQIPRRGWVSLDETRDH